MIPSDRALAPVFVRLAGHPLRWQLLTELARSDLRVRELVTLIDQPQNLVSYHLRRLRDGGLVTTTRSTFDGRDSYYHLDLDRCAHALAGTGEALHPALRVQSQPSWPSRPPQPPSPSPAPRVLPRLAVLFVCTGNSARSPIAEALLRRYVAGQVEVISAGSHPGTGLHPLAVRVLREHFGVDAAAQHPRHLDTLAGRRFDYVVTLCDRAREVCPDFGDPSRRLHWSVPDPAAPAAGDGDPAGFPVFARTAADIDTRVRQLLPVLADTPALEVEP